MMNELCRDCYYFTGEEKLQGRECENPQNQRKWRSGQFSLSVKYKKPTNKACKKFLHSNPELRPSAEGLASSSEEKQAPKGTSKWMGLWAQERQAFYAGQVIKKSDIPKFTRIVLRYNKFYEKDSNRPRFVYCFADSEGYADKCVPIELEEGRPYKKDGVYYTADGERLYTKEDARAIINGTVADVHYGINDPYDILPEDFV